ncbi:MAG: alpha/beta hydrolase, partial [Parvularculaceae bacterium]|nr:alpha/beta hydrolase [Parvularculaceae bacterium]
MLRGFLKIDGRFVHLRRMGRGPALVLLHGSPNSSLSLVPLMEAMSARFNCIALDTPGNGLSDPLREDNPSTEDYAAALGLAVDALGLRRFSLYGFHTGAGTAAAYAGAHPERVASMVLDGCAVWTESEKRSMLSGYLPTFRPDPMGAHLAWLWSRIAEQTMFFPWHRPSAETRMDYDMPAPDILHRTAMEFLSTGDHYRKPYAAALAGDGAARVRKLATRTLITAHPLDPIAHHLDRLEGYRSEVLVLRETRLDRDAVWRGFASFLSETPGDAAPG